MKTSIGLAALLTAAALGAPALAGPAPAASDTWKTESVRVPYEDLDLTHASGMQALQTRVSRAADQVCGDPSQQLKVEMTRRRCRRDALASASEQMSVARQAALQGRTILLARRR